MRFRVSPLAAKNPWSSKCPPNFTWLNSAKKICVVCLGEEELKWPGVEESFFFKLIQAWPLQFLFLPTPPHTQTHTHFEFWSHEQKDAAMVISVRGMTSWLQTVAKWTVVKLEDHHLKKNDGRLDKKKKNHTKEHRSLSLSSMQHTFKIRRERERGREMQNGEWSAFVFLRRFLRRKKICSEKVERTKRYMNTTENTVPRNSKWQPESSKRSPGKKNNALLSPKNFPRTFSSAGSVLPTELSATNS